MSLFDAHCHLQDSRLNGVRDGLWESYRAIGLGRVVVNGTRESDWDGVRDLAGASDMVKPSYGLHPWFLNTASSGWQDRLERLWGENSDAAVGEIGFDRWKEPYDMEAQREAFVWQFDHATRLNKPVSIHCLKAWGILIACLRERERPQRGFLLHSFGGSWEVAQQLLALGGYFSFSNYFGHERKGAVREVFKRLPADRILIETDAPDMAGPPASMLVRVPGDEMVNHPQNIRWGYDCVAKLRGIAGGEWERQVAENFRRFFG